MDLKPFSLEDYYNGAHVVTQEGVSVTLEVLADGYLSVTTAENYQYRIDASGKLNPESSFFLDLFVMSDNEWESREKDKISNVLIRKLTLKDQDLIREAKKLTKKTSASQAILQICRDHFTLREYLLDLKAENERLKKENEELRCGARMMLNGLGKLSEVLSSNT